MTLEEESNRVIDKLIQWLEMFENVTVEKWSFTETNHRFIERAEKRGLKCFCQTEDCLYFRKGV